MRKTFPDIKAQLPPGMTADIAYDSTKFIDASIREVEKTLLEAAVIVIVVIFLFLGSLRSTLIPIVTIPLSLIGVMFALLALGYSINLLTLLALVLAIGLVVDDAIVVVENVHRHIESGCTAFDAALLGRPRDFRADHLHDDHARRGLRADRLRLRPHRRTVPRVRLHARGRRHRIGRHRADAVADDGSSCSAASLVRPLRPLPRPRLRGLKHRYQRRLRRTLNYRPVTLLVLLGIIVATGLMYTTAQKELAPEEDQGILFNLIKTPQGANLDYLEQVTEQLDKVFDTVPEKEHVFAINGIGGDVNQAFHRHPVQAVGRAPPHAAADPAELQPKVAGIAGGQIFSFAPPSLPGSTGGPPVQFVITTTADYEQLAQVLADMQRKPPRAAFSSSPTPT